ncbi:hypothetical protein BDY21DRAFT_341740, partial [Lineolata rhizophorae]
MASSSEITTKRVFKLKFMRFVQLYLIGIDSAFVVLASRRMTASRMKLMLRTFTSTNPDQQMPRCFTLRTICRQQGCFWSRLIRFTAFRSFLRFSGESPLSLS